MFFLPRQSSEKSFKNFLKRNHHPTDHLNIDIQIVESVVVASQSSQHQDEEISSIEGVIHLEIEEGVEHQESSLEFKSLSLYLEGALDPEQEESLKYWTLLSQIGLLIPKLDMMDFYVSSYLISPDEPKNSRRVPPGRHSFPFKIELDCPAATKNLLENSTTTSVTNASSWTPVTLVVRGKVKGGGKFGRYRSVEAHKLFFISSRLKPNQILLLNHPQFLTMKKKMLFFPHSIIFLKVELAVAKKCYVIGGTVVFNFSLITSTSNLGETDNKRISELSVKFCQSHGNDEQVGSRGGKEILKLFWHGGNGGKHPPSSQFIEDEASRKFDHGFPPRIHWTGQFTIPDHLVPNSTLVGGATGAADMEAQSGMEISYFLKFALDLNGKRALEGETMIFIEETP